MVCMHVCCHFSCAQLHANQQTLQPTRLLCPWNTAGKNTGVGCHALFQGIFLTQQLNSSLLGLMHWRAVSLLLAPPGKAYVIYILPQYFLKQFLKTHEERIFLFIGSLTWLSVALTTLFPKNPGAQMTVQTEVRRLPLFIPEAIWGNQTTFQIS